MFAALQEHAPNLAKKFADHTLTVLDVGTGKGKFVDLLTDTGLRNAFGIERNKNLGTEMRKMKQGGRVVIGETQAMPYKDESFELVTCFGALDGSYYKNNYKKFFDEVYRVLKKGGVFFTIDAIYDIPSESYAGFRVLASVAEGRPIMLIKD